MSSSNAKIDITFVDAQVQDVITDEQAQFFLDNGFLVIRNVIVGEELRLIREEMMKWVEEGAAGVNDSPDFKYGKGIKSGKNVLRRIDYIIDKSDPMKVLLGHPFILRSVEKLQGCNFIPTYDSMVLKIPDEGVIVPWHRDAEAPYGSADLRPIFNVDFYLDPSDYKNCLWVIPGSNLWELEEANKRCVKDGREKFSTEDAIPVPLNAGDVIFHDIKVLHGSPSGDGNALRRTVYYEFRPAEIEKKFGPHTPEYIGLKQQVLLECIKRRVQTAYCRGETSFTYSPEGEFSVSEIREPSTFRYAHEDYWRKKK